MTGMGKLIKDKREQAGLTQQALAEQIGVSQGAVSQYETDVVVPRPGKLVAIAGALGLSPDELLAMAGYYEPVEERPLEETPASGGGTALPRQQDEPGDDERRLREVAQVLAQLVRQFFAPALWPRLLEELGRALAHGWQSPSHETTPQLPSEQRWYWGKEWQEAEEEASRDYDAGRSKVYQAFEDLLDSLPRPNH